MVPPLRANPLPAKLTYLPSGLPRKSKNSPSPCDLTQNTIPYRLFPPTLLRPLVEKSRIPLLGQPNLENPPSSTLRASLPTYPLLLSLHAPLPTEAGRRPSNPLKPVCPSCLPCRGPGPAHPMQLPCRKKNDARTLLPTLYT